MSPAGAGGAPLPRKTRRRWVVAIGITIAAVSVFLWRGISGSGERADSFVPRVEGDSPVFPERPAEQPARRAVLDSGEEIEGDFRILSFDEVLREGGTTSALDVAIEKYPDKLRELLASGVFDANTRLPFGEGQWEMPIEKAMRQGTEETFEILMAAGADPNLRNSDGANALHYAAFDGLLGALEIFLDAGADPALPDYDGATALRKASFGGHLDVVERLLAAGADPEHSALWAAASEGRAEIVKRLVEVGARPEGSPGRDPDGAGRCPMWQAALGGHTETVRLLLGFGAPPTCEGFSLQPVDIARRQGHREVVDLLEGEEGE